MCCDHGNRLDIRNESDKWKTVVNNLWWGVMCVSILFPSGTYLKCLCNHYVIYVFGSQSI